MNADFQEVTKGVFHPMAQETISLKLLPREVLGKQVRRLRRDGLVPAVIHDHGKPSVHVQADYNSIAKVYRQAGKHHPVSLTADGKNYLAIIKSATFEPKKNTLNHVVFNAVKANEKVEAEVPIRPRYDEGNDASPAERNSLIVLTNLDAVMVEAVPASLPDVLEYDAEKLVEVGDHLTVADLIIPEGVVVKIEPEHAIATVYEPSAIAAANDDAGGDAQPGDEQAVESEVEPENAEESGQGDEIRPGGKKEFEDKEQGHNPEKQ
jgi:large subunit ribosomal protein L25